MSVKYKYLCGIIIIISVIIIPQMTKIIINKNFSEAQEIKSIEQKTLTEIAEDLRIKHNEMGKLFEEGKITSEEWEKFKEEEFKKQNKWINYLLSKDRIAVEYMSSSQEFSIF